MDRINKFMINGDIYVSYEYLKDKITAHRLKLWRERKGQAKNIDLKYIRLGGIFLYRLIDINRLIDLTKINKEDEA